LSKKIVITGGCGFIGSHLVELLSESNEVIAFDRYNSESDHYWLTNSKFKGRFSVVLGDIRDYDSVQSVLKGADVVIHMAALIGIPYSYVSPLAYIRTNVEGTYNVLQASKELELNQVMITSTSETYGTAQYVPMDEDHPKVGQSPYSASKISADQIAISYHRSFDLPVTIVRPFNTYGPRQSSRAVIPNIVSQILTNNGEVNLGNISPTRDFTFVEDTCSAFESIIGCNKLIGEEVNIGTNSEISIKDLVKEISNIIGIEAKIVEDGQRMRVEKSEVDRLVCKNEKLLACTGWKPKHSLEQGLIKTIDWIKKVDSDKLKNMSQYNV
tara:strand:+ start:292 stop:1272 length:981 start_codon:yes stop_codon:yes gene_type:complete